MEKFKLKEKSWFLSGEPSELKSEGGAFCQLGTIMLLNLASQCCQVDVQGGNVWAVLPLESILPGEEFSCREEGTGPCVELEVIPSPTTLDPPHPTPHPPHHQPSSYSITRGTKEGPEIDDQAGPGVARWVTVACASSFAAAGLRIAPWRCLAHTPHHLGWCPTRAWMVSWTPAPAPPTPSLHNMSPQMSAAAAAAAVVAYGRLPMVRMAGTEDGCGWDLRRPAPGSPHTFRQRPSVSTAPCPPSSTCQLH